jgi:uncharacterized protein (TIGR03083 family)
VHFSDHCDQIDVQTSLLAELVATAGLTTPVPTCGDWSLEHLVRHVGGGHRWAAETVRTRATAPLSDHGVRDVAGYPPLDAPSLAAWLVEGASELVEALREAGPDTPLWSPVEPEGRAAFYARRFAHETLVHRADAVLAVGEAFDVEPATAVDALDEWFELGSLPAMHDFHPERRELLGAGRTIHLHAHDGVDAEWVVDLTGDVQTWRRAHEKSAVAVRGALTDLLLLVYRRRTPGGLEVLGDAALLEQWLAHAAFG